MDRPGQPCARCREAWEWCKAHQDPQLRERLTEVAGQLDRVAGHSSPFLDPSRLFAMEVRGETAILCATRREGNWIRRRYVEALAHALEVAEVRVGIPYEVRDFISNDHDNERSNDAR